MTTKQDSLLKVSQTEVAMTVLLALTIILALALENQEQQKVNEKMAEFTVTFRVKHE